MEPSSKQLSVSISIKLSNLRPLSSDCCIYRVSEDLRSINREAYRPSVVSIGPFHYKDKRLRAMKEYKLRYLKSFLSRAKNHNLEYYVNVVKGREALVRGSYAEEFNLGSDTFIEMVLVDAAFIIELFLRKWFHELREENDRIFGRPGMIDQVTHDIKLEENQLPFFIIRELYAFACEPYPLVYPFFSMLTCKFFRFTEIELDLEPMHFVDFLRYCYLSSSPGESGERPCCFSVTYLHKAGVKFVDFLRACFPPPKPDESGERPCCFSVTYLHKAGVKFVDFLRPCFPPPKPDESGERPCCFSVTYLHKVGVKFVDFLRACFPPPKPVESSEQPCCFNVAYLHKAGVKFELAKKGSSLLDITFDCGVLKIPKIRIEDSTESIWRNLLVFEQCHQFEVTHIIDFLSLLDFLIDDPKDVEMLIQDKIIENWLGTNEDVSDLFRKLRNHIMMDPLTFYYRDICQKLNDHCNSTWCKNRAILRQKYFNHPWAVLSVISAIVLLLLTVIQAITGVISVIHK
ncbi:hypothetical protein Ancab_000839 [Ancistrocladus abbreviatus]